MNDEEKKEVIACYLKINPDICMNDYEFDVYLTEAEGGKYNSILLTLFSSNLYNSDNTESFFVKKSYSIKKTKKPKQDIEKLVVKGYYFNYIYGKSDYYARIDCHDLNFNSHLMNKDDILNEIVQLSKILEAMQRNEDG